MLSTKTKIALAAFVHHIVTGLRQLGGLGLEVEVKRSGIRWMLDLDEGIDFSIWLLRAFEWRTVQAYTKFVRPGMTVLDIGANIGAHTLPLAKLVGSQGRVMAIEPTAWATSRLKANAALNPSLAGNILIRQVMLVDRDDTALVDALYASWPLRGNDVHPHLRAQAKSTDGAEALTLDALLERDRLGRVDLVKLDVDGHECSVLRGGMKMFKRDRPVLFIELQPYILVEAGHSIDELLALLAECGYRIYWLGTKTPLPMDPVALQRLIPETGSINAVAIAGQPSDFEKR
jgi:FkbM family methyltransferase